jgi:hypothetical protein
MTSKDNEHILLVQINKDCKDAALKRTTGGKSLAITKTVQVPSAPDELDPSEVKRRLKEAICF